jgi:iron-sulfur cluster insertion protein
MSEESFNITLTDSLVHRIRQEQVTEAKPDLMLRLAVHGGGCAGFQYDFSYTEGIESGDVVFEKDSVKVVIDDMSIEYLRGATIDFSEELIGSAFCVRNPNAQSSCGCGTSFSV